MSFKDQLIEFIEKHFDGSSQESQLVNEGVEEPAEYSSVAKSVDIEKRHFTAVVLRPNHVDLHGDIYDEDCVEKACHQYNELCRQANIQHLIQTELATPIESYIAKSNFNLGEGEVLAGDWIMTMKINDDGLWSMCKDGTFTGFSVGCMAKTEKINDET